MLDAKTAQMIAENALKPSNLEEAVSEFMLKISEKIDFACKTGEFDVMIEKGNCSHTVWQGANRKSIIP